METRLVPAYHCVLKFYIQHVFFFYLLDLHVCFGQGNIKTLSELFILAFFSIFVLFHILGLPTPFFAFLDHLMQFSTTTHPGASASLKRNPTLLP